MKYLKLFNEDKNYKNYKDYIDSGFSHNIFYIDDKYILKMPSDTDHQSLLEFDEHIKTMKKYPDLFPNVKKLDKYRASIEFVDVEKAKEEYRKIWYYIYNLSKTRIAEDETMEFLLDNPKYLEMLNIEPADLDDAIILKWYKFLKKLHKSELFKEQHCLDLHRGNFGIDKNGNIKLIDF